MDECARLLSHSPFLAAVFVFVIVCNARGDEGSCFVDDCHMLSENNSGSHFSALGIFKERTASVTLIARVREMGRKEKYEN